MPGGKQNEVTGIFTPRVSYRLKGTLIYDANAPVY